MITIPILCLFSACGSGEKLDFPPGFIWGAACSAYQTEGDNFKNDWYQWEKINSFIGTPAGKAVNSYVLYDTDAKLVKDINLNSFRFSVEWSRVEPERGVWDDAEIEHYRQVLTSITSRGIRPFLTLHHFTNPLWVMNLDHQQVPIADLGGWENPETAVEFAEYAGKLAREYGDQVDYWLTINEPIIIALSGYLYGLYPPGERVFSPGQITQKVIPVMKNLITAHALAADAIRANDLVDADGDGRATVVGLAESVVLWDPYPPDDPQAQAAARRLDQFYSKNLFDSLTAGGFDDNLDGVADDTRTEWQGRLDFIGFNYYNHWYVVNIPLLPAPIAALPCISFRGLDLSQLGVGCPAQIGEKSDMGYEIYPEGIYRILKDLSGRYTVPILITENGIATTDGEKRAQFLADHLRWVHRAVSEGMNVIGYIYWSLTDNWEWGTFTPRFGLYTVDYQNNYERQLNRGGEMMGEIAECNCLSLGILKRYPVRK